MDIDRATTGSVIKNPECVKILSKLGKSVPHVEHIVRPKDHNYTIQELEDERFTWNNFIKIILLTSKLLGFQTSIDFKTSADIPSNINLEISRTIQLELMVELDKKLKEQQ